MFSADTIAKGFPGDNLDNRHHIPSAPDPRSSCLQEGTFLTARDACVLYQNIRTNQFKKSEYLMVEMFKYNKIINTN